MRRYNQQSELAWDEGERKHIILQHVFDPDDARTNVFFYDELKRELEAELRKCGPIVSLKIFERNPDGVVAVKFEQDWAAARCIEVMHERWFDGRRLTADYYDGYSNYFVPETDEERAARDAMWERWLEGNDAQQPGAPHQQPRAQVEEDDWWDTRPSAAGAATTTAALFNKARRAPSESSSDDSALEHEDEDEDDA